MPKKFTVINDVLGLKNKNGLYCILPFEQLDEKEKAIFKCGMTSKQEFATRLEQYHGAFPMGLYLCFFLCAKLGQDIKQMEKDLFKELKKNGANQLKFSTRIKLTEWFYTNFDTLDESFSNIESLYPGSKLERYHIKNINKIGDTNLNSKKDKYIGKIVYFV